MVGTQYRTNPERLRLCIIDLFPYSSEPPPQTDEARSKWQNTKFGYRNPWPRPGFLSMSIKRVLTKYGNTVVEFSNVAPPDPVPVSGRGGQAETIFQ